MDFSKSPASPEEALRLVARVAAGREVLERFLELYRAGRVKIEPYPAAVLKRLRQALGEGQPVGACFVNDGSTGTIHFDPQAPIGVLAPFLVHEMVHAADDRLWQAARLPQTRRERDQVVLEAEVKAFELQHRFVEELRAADPGYSDFLVTQQARVRVLHERLTRDDIATLYRIRAS